KRLYKIFMDKSQIRDPYFQRKVRLNQTALDLVSAAPFESTLNFIDPADWSSFTNLDQLKLELDLIKLGRLIALSVADMEQIKSISDHPTAADIQALFDIPAKGRGLEMLSKYLVQHSKKKAGGATIPLKILYLANESGEIIFDLAVMNHLTSMGHIVAMALKKGPTFTKAAFSDVYQDSIIREATADFLVIRDSKLTRNSVAPLFRGGQKHIIFSDGTHEDLNFKLTSVTFARIFKEVDLVISKGPEQLRRITETHFTFTQDIINFSRDAEGRLLAGFKAMSPDVVKFDSEDLAARAYRIIDQMRQAKRDKKRVIFYSGIIGSIPGQIDVAKKIMTVFVTHLSSRLDNTFIIDPSQYFEPGMDADDLMHMWEIVQRSGLIDIWRFQSHEDIEESFSLLNQKVPYEWAGKDSTFSTGCTKEMNIALDIKKKNPEMQIIGPPPGSVPAP
ncbi:MAG: DUF89 family protein, partial [Deltaproteobacteria bacterium]|nr:DUF89 family protein [Deltaproteobacteria bacterium]